MIYGPVRHLYLLLTSSEYRNMSIYYSKYANAQRYIETTVKLGRHKLTVPDIASFLSQYKEIYLNKIYAVPMDNPKILDLGANIGLSVIWFKENFPGSEILAIEADPKIYRYLKDNTSALDGVSLQNIAAWDEDRELSFYSEGADGGRIEAIEACSSPPSVKVAAVDIRCILKEKGPFDFIKMDIEGAEARVLSACQGLLQETRFVFCEYHSIEGEKQHLDDVLSLLNAEGFRMHIQPVNMSGQPFMKRRIYADFDMTLNIFAWKS